MKVLILMPIYNGIEFIDESVPSIISQTFQDWVLYIGVNGHPPNSEVYQIAKKYESDKIFVYDLDVRGKVDSLNKLVDISVDNKLYSSLTHIALLDVDDIWLPTKLERQVPYCEQGYDIVGTQCRCFGNANNLPNIPYGDISNFDFFILNPVINSSSIFKKEYAFWRKRDGIEDYDMWLRLRRENKRFFNISDVLVKHRIHRESAFNAKGNHNFVPALLNEHRAN